MGGGGTPGVVAGGGWRSACHVTSDPYEMGAALSPWCSLIVETGGCVVI